MVQEVVSTTVDNVDPAVCKRHSFELVALKDSYDCLSRELEASRSEQVITAKQVQEIHKQIGHASDKVSRVPGSGIALTIEEQGKAIREVKTAVDKIANCVDSELLSRARDAEHVIISRREKWKQIGQIIAAVVGGGGLLGILQAILGH